MGEANVNLEVLKGAYRQIQSVESFCQRVIAFLDGQYQEMGAQWNDRLYHELGEILEEECYVPLRQLGERTTLLSQTLKAIAAKVQAYEETDILGPGAVRGGSFRPAPKCPNPRYRTSIDESVCEVKHVELPDSEKSTFLDGEYRTVVAMQDLTLYRVYGGNSNKKGWFLTTEQPRDKLDVKVSSALLQEWNGRTQYCEVQVPAGTKMHIGKAAPQRTRGGNVLPGGVTQVLIHGKSEKKAQNLDALVFGESHPLGYAVGFLEFESKVNGQNDEH